MGSVMELEHLVTIGIVLSLTGSEPRSWIQRGRAELSAIRAAEQRVHIEA